MTTDRQDTPDEALRGTVAAIVSNRAIAINRGSADGVTVGTRFAVLYSGDVGMVTDPETGDLLGSVDLPKVVVKVFRVAGPHLCVARTYRKIPGSPGRPSGYANIFSIMDPYRSIGATPDEYETLTIDAAERIDQKISEEDSFVEVGDPVVLVRNDEYDGYSEYR